MAKRTAIGTTHVIAECRDCSARWEDYRTAVAQAAAHADRTGHTVRVERGQSWTYNDR